MIDEETKTDFLNALEDVRTHAEALLADCRAGRRGNRPESEDELMTVLEELKEIEGRALRDDPRPDRPGSHRLVSARIALDWNYSDLADRVMTLSGAWKALW
jgi:hypothetical protein